MFSVYCHENKANNKVYIGITGQNPKDRWKGGTSYKKNEKFYSDIQKYGWDGFEHRCIVDGVSAEQAAKIEAELIRAYDSVKQGYNKSHGVSTYSERLFNTAAGNIYRGLKSHKGFFENEIAFFDNAKADGAGSNFLENVNLICDHIVEQTTKDGDPPGYTSFEWLCRFSYELGYHAKRFQYWEEHNESVDGFDYPTWEEALHNKINFLIGGTQI